MRSKISAGIAGLVAGVSLVLTGCNVNSDNNVQPQIPVSYVAIYNESPDSPGLSFVIDNNQINYHPLDYSEYSGYLSFYTGTRTLKVGPFGASNIVVDTTLTLVDQKYYSVFIVDNYSKAEALVLSDSGQAPAAGFAKVRLVNLSPDAGSVKLTAGSAVVADSLNFKAATQFVQVDATTKKFTVTSDDGGTVNLALPDTNLVSGAFYTFLVRGYKTPPTGNTNVLSAEVVSN